MIKYTKLMVPPGRLELPLPKESDFESDASTNSTTGALLNMAKQESSLSYTEEQ